MQTKVALKVQEYSKVYALLRRVRPAILAELLLACLGPRNRIIVEASSGLLFWVDPLSELGAALLSVGIYEPQMQRLIQACLRSGDTFIDVGACDGYFSVHASRILSGGRVHCIEPQQRMQSIIRQNITLNHCTNVILHPVALLDQPHQTELYLRPGTNPGASSLFPQYRFSRAQKVQATSLDVLFEQSAIDHARLIKIDCEGAEHLVMQGGEKALARKQVDFIAIEYHPHIGVDGYAHCKRTHQFLKANGYVLTKASGQTIYHLPGMDSILNPLGNLEINCEL